MDEVQVESLSSILGNAHFSTGEPAKADPAPPAAEAKSETPKTEQTTETEAKTETPAQARDESGKLAAKTEEPTQTAAPPAKEEADGRNIALKEARERYRRAEAALKDLQANEAKAPKVSIFDNEDEGIAQRVAEHARPLKEANFNMSVKLARLTYQDGYEKAEAAFFDSAEVDQRLYQQLRAAADPGEFIMTVGTQIAELAPVGGDFIKYREKVTGELQTELGKRDEQIKALTAQLEALSKAQKELEAVPRSLNTSQSGATPKGEDADPDDLKNLVRFKTG
jgi:hypothetical protein